MMPGARFFFLSHVQLFVLPDGRIGRADYNQLRRAAVLPILPAALFVFEPVLVLLAVGHGGAFEGPRFCQLVVGDSLSIAQAGTGQVGIA